MEGDGVAVLIGEGDFHDPTTTGTRKCPEPFGRSQMIDAWRFKNSRQAGDGLLLVPDGRWRFEAVGEGLQEPIAQPHDP